MINALIVDDEPLARDILETFIEKIDSINLVGKCQNAIEANQVLKTEKVDLLFLDIQMPELSGIEFLKSLSNPPQVIFTTAYPDYAIEGFELNALDYLLKPISFDRFIKAANKAEEALKKAEIAEEVEDDYFFVKADKKLIKINHEDILYIEGLKDYVIIKQKEGRVITLQTMKSLEAKLPVSTFMRVHRSYIVNLGGIKAVEGNTIYLNDDNKTSVPIGKNYRERLLEIINEKRL